MDRAELIESITDLYTDIDKCINGLIISRVAKDSIKEGESLFRMEGLMVATLQELSCIYEYLVGLDEQDDDDDFTCIF